MPNEPRRVTDPARATTEFAPRRMGVRGQHETDVERQRQTKTTDDPARRAIIVPTQTIRFARDEVSSSSEQVLPPWDSPNIDFTTSYRYPFGAAGRVLGGVIVTDVARTAGTVAVLIRLSKGGGTETAYTFGDWVLDGATIDGHVRDQSAALLLPWPNGLAFAKGDACRVSVLFTGYTPDLSDWIVDLVVGYAGLSGT